LNTNEKHPKSDNKMLIDLQLTKQEVAENHHLLWSFFLKRQNFLGEKCKKRREKGGIFN